MLAKFIYMMHLPFSSKVVAMNNKIITAKYDSNLNVTTTTTTV